MKSDFDTHRLLHPRCGLRYSVVTYWSLMGPADSPYQPADCPPGRQQPWNRKM